MLIVEELKAAYGGVEVLHGISLQVDDGELVSLIGANGAGKTTTLRAICGLVRPTSGRIRFDGMDLARLPAHRVARSGVNMCPEGRQVFPRMTILENLELGALARTGREVRDDIKRMFEMFPVLGERRSQLAGTLSGGEQEMLAIARVLMSRPRLCIFDEPSLGLAPKIVAEVERIIGQIHATGVTVLLVEQNARMALRLANRAYVLEAGEITLSGPAATLERDPEVQRAYLGH